MNLEFDKAGIFSYTQFRELQIFSSEFIYYSIHFCPLKQESAQRIQLRVFEETASVLVLYKVHEAYSYLKTSPK
jgi:hypothetical protein